MFLTQKVLFRLPNATPFTVMHQLALPVRIFHLANNGTARAFRAYAFRVVGHAPLCYFSFNIQEPVVRQSSIVRAVVVVPSDSLAVEWC